MKVRKFVEILNHASESEIEKIVEKNLREAFRALPYVRENKKAILARVLARKMAQMSVMELLLFFGGCEYDVRSRCRHVIEFLF